MHRPTVPLSSSSRAVIRRVLGSVATVILAVAAGGLVCWFVYASVAGATLITFRTGSMSPTMPQGSVAVTLPVSAAELEVGDVITVQRAGEAMPVTHRVMEVGPVIPQQPNAPDIRAASPGSGPPDLSSSDARQVVMQGDDNDTPDQLPYALTDARRVVFAVPHVGAALMVVQSPIGMGTLILLVGALVVWAFWPRADPDVASYSELAPAAPAAAQDPAQSPDNIPEEALPR